MTNAKHHILANAFSLTEAQRDWCTVCKLLYFPNINYLDIRKQVEFAEYDRFLWDNRAILHGRTLACSIVFPELPSMKDAEALAGASLICSIRECDHLSWAVFAPMYTEAKSPYKLYTVRCSTEVLLSNNFWHSSVL